MLKRHIRFLTLPSAAAANPHMSETLFSSSCLFKPLLPNTQSNLIGQLAQAWANASPVSSVFASMVT